ncbi:MULTISPECIES: ferredoxin III, nif-specific [Methylocaldum]|jgi:Nif-specific ferredoxin III|uniref:ferredoxin III, nif-specific n=1 Tax=unclassified Methylocaldum TaxID=2622260 RepID=UPI00098B2AB3|nr:MULTISPECIES: ferredoxin III, nif-specific [unclassified Methylocaldum]MBP1148627.1 Nif-specific ferredoxin III [Methylocaldum sp. RMAD-M]MDV3241104.1 ferredoxin III, nif-specific [Methylocaldum sp.]MVF20090.1 ferredoxin III, nif-specific [Methylocaldum sp. BRCS4]
MSEFTVTLPGGKVWTPKFVEIIDQEKCIGCGRCYKVCGREVLEMVGVNEDGEIVTLSQDEDEDDEYDKKVMSIANVANCVGCEACAKICPKQCYTHEAAAA